MNAEDRQLLEWAARAAGIEYIISSNGTFLVAPYMNPLARVSWNPLYDDGDALRLAVKLRIAVDPWGAGACAVTFCPGDKPQIREPHYGDDPLRATRRAIVRAAAEIGKAMV